MSGHDDLLAYVQNKRMQIINKLMPGDEIPDPESKAMRALLTALKDTDGTVIARQRLSLDERAANDRDDVMATLHKIESQIQGNPYRRPGVVVDHEGAPNRPAVYHDESNWKDGEHVIGDDAQNYDAFMSRMGATPGQAYMVEHDETVDPEDE